MKVVLLGNAKSIHIIRWANGLSKKGIDIHLISLDDKPEADVYDSEVSFHKLKGRPPYGYFLSVLHLKQLLKQINPDILNVHYASGYGTLGRLANFHPLLLSVWGADVYDFPNENKIKRQLIIKNLRGAEGIASTSNAMLKVTNALYEHRNTFVTPFGVDTDVFLPSSNKPENNAIIIGTVKTLSPKYGIDTLIKAFSIVKINNNGVPLKLEIVGAGPQEADLKSLTNDLGLNDFVKFYGFVEHKKIVPLLQDFDIYVALSRLDSESFGVAIIEASSCGVPVVVSDADGPAEVVVDGTTGFVVPKNDEYAAAKALEKLIIDPNLRKTMGANGRTHVVNNYSWEKSLEIMIYAYEKTCERGCS